MPANIIYLIIFTFFKVCVSKRYNNYTLYRAIPVNESHLEFFSNIEEFYDVNFWRDPGVAYRPVDFVINPSDKSSFLGDAEENGIYLTTIIGDVQRAFDKQTVKTYVRRQMDSFDWNNYYRLGDIYNWLDDLVKKYPKEVQLESIGKSYENRDIMSVRIMLNGFKKPRSTVIIEGGIHAREWIAPAFVTYLIYQVVTAENSKDQSWQQVANLYEWYFVPVLNVDGYEYTHTEDRLWRKNRNGHGVDLNRNFGHAFGTSGVSKAKRSDVYCGESAFSEKESKAMADFVTSKSKHLEYYIAFHSYGQYMIIPYANLRLHADNFDEMYTICRQVAEKVAVRYDTKYEVGTSYDTVGYLSSGVSGCWTKATFKVPYVVTFELRDQGNHGFALPPEHILPTCLETMDGVIELLTPKQKVPRMLGGADSSIRAGKGCQTTAIRIIFNFILLFCSIF